MHQDQKREGKRNLDQIYDKQDRIVTDDSLWICPNCKTKNYGRKCGICNTYKPSIVVCKCGHQNSAGNRYCSACGALLKEKDRHGPNGLVISVIAVVLLALIGYFSVHIWTERTCTEPSVCRICGKVREAALDHEWSKATCDIPSTCANCGATRGTTLQHRWQPATCNDPETCANCDATRGTTLEHQWQDATYRQAQTCTECHTTQGKSLPYPLSWCYVLESTNESNAQRDDIAKGKFLDCFGSYYSDAIEFWTADFSRWADTESIVYQLGSEFELLEFTIAASRDNDPDGESQILIYADNVLLYASKWVGNNTTPIKGSVDVTNVRELKIECTTDSDVFCYCIFDAQLYVQG